MIKSQGPLFQEKKNLQLEILYDISKAIASFETLEKTFPILMTLMARVIPVNISILTEGRGEIVTTTTWHSKDMGEGQVYEVMTLGRQLYGQLATPIPAITNLERSDYIALPLVVYSRPIFGVLLLKGSARLDESDLAFADAITNLISIAIDRYYTANDLEKLHKKFIEDLERERDLRESFVSTLTHDLRNSFGATKMYAQLIGKSNIPDNYKEISRKILKGIERIDYMIENLLDANRIRAGERLPLKIEEFDMREMLKATLYEVSEVCGEQIIFDENQNNNQKNTKQEIRGYWSRDGIRRALENLINNAFKYGFPNRPITVSLKEKQIDQTIEIGVHNEGTPIPSEDLANLFHMHHRTKAAKASGVRGWGIGLTLVRGMVEAHGGTVHVESAPEAGTTFTMILPRDCRFL